MGFRYKITNCTSLFASICVFVSYYHELNWMKQRIDWTGFVFVEFRNFLVMIADFHQYTYLPDFFQEINLLHLNYRKMYISRLSKIVPLTSVTCPFCLYRNPCFLQFFVTYCHFSSQSALKHATDLILELANTIKIKYVCTNDHVRKSTARSPQLTDIEFKLPSQFPCSKYHLEVRDFIQVLAEHFFVKLLLLLPLWRLNVCLNFSSEVSGKKLISWFLVLKVNNYCGKI